MLLSATRVQLCNRFSKNAEFTEVKAEEPKAPLKSDPILV